MTPLTDDVIEFITLLAVSLVAVVVWVILMVREFMPHPGERRNAEVLMHRIMSVIGLLTAIGYLASSIWFGGEHVASLQGGTPQAFLVFVAAIGRGALLMGGVMALYSAMHFTRQPQKEEE